MSQRPRIRSPRSFVTIDGKAYAVDVSNAAATAPTGTCGGEREPGSIRCSQCEHYVRNRRGSFSNSVNRPLLTSRRHTNNIIDVHVQE
jgi:hypothetical protein